MVTALGCGSLTDPRVSTGPDPCDAALFCDDFEAYTAGVAPTGAWTPVEVNATVRVDDSRAFGGALSVKATTAATSSTLQVYKAALIGLAQAPVVPVPNEAFYGRMMFFMSAAPPASVQWTFIDATGIVPGQEYSATYRYGGGWSQKPGTAFANQLMAGYDTPDFYRTPPIGPQTDCYKHAASKIVPAGEWACAEWFFDGPQAQMRFWLDGAELTEIWIDGTGEGCMAQATDYPWVAPAFSRIDVGLQSYQADDERSIWIDDVVISSSRVACPSRLRP
jgi:hypothetical protein